MKQFDFYEFTGILLPGAIVLTALVVLFPGCGLPTLIKDISFGGMGIFIVLAYAVGPTLQGIVSRSVDAAEQGRAMGALASLASLTAVIAPMIGTPLLAQVSDLPPEDWRVGTVYLLAAALQALALALAAWHFRHHPLRRAAPPGA